MSMNLHDSKIHDWDDVQVLILGGGLGTRLRDSVPGKPKILAPIAGRPFVRYLLAQLAAAGITEATISTGYLADMIEQELGKESDGVRLSYCRELVPLGTGGALRMASSNSARPWLLAMNGDSYVAAELRDFSRRCRESQTRGGLLLTWVEDCGRFGRVDLDSSNRITAFNEKTSSGGAGWINAGVYFLQRSLFDDVAGDRPVSLESELFPRWLREGLIGHCRRAPFIDIGTPASYVEANNFFHDWRANESTICVAG